MEQRLGRGCPEVGPLGFLVASDRCRLADPVVVADPVEKPGKARAWRRWLDLQWRGQSLQLVRVNVRKKGRGKWRLLCRGFIGFAVMTATSSDRQRAQESGSPLSLTSGHRCWPLATICGGLSCLEVAANDRRWPSLVSPSSSLSWDHR